MLTVKIIESTDIPVRDLSGHSYSFVQVKLLPFHKESDTIYKTGLVRPATFNPRYGDGFTFCISQKEAKDQVNMEFMFFSKWFLLLFTLPRNLNAGRPLSGDHCHFVAIAMLPRKNYDSKSLES